uniref:HD-GYP domain-containing protein n=1 Tax=candidate division WOR-3 bacterium TaxID=2052148 RepID=A0A7V3ZX79_UNCW3
MSNSNIELVVRNFEESLKIIEEALKELRERNKEISSLLERQTAKLALAKTISEALYLLTDPFELFQALVSLLSKIKGFSLPFIIIYNPEKGFNTFVVDDGKRPFIEKIIAEILISDEDPFKKEVLNKKLEEGAEFPTLLAVPIEVEEEFKGFIGVLSKGDEIRSDDYDYLRELSQNISTALRQRMLIQKLESANIKLKESLKSSIILIEKIIELKDPYGKIHGDNVGELVAEIGKRMGLEEERVEYLVYAGMIHDVGKISLPAEILHKPGTLTDVEFALIKLHPEIGYEFLKDLSFPYLISEIVYQHHERWNGSGYPRGLKNGEILLEARILSVAEVVESMTHFRSWRDAYKLEDVLKYIQENKNVQFDPEVVDTCVEVFNSGFRFKN